MHTVTQTAKAFYKALVLFFLLVTTLTSTAQQSSKAETAKQFIQAIPADLRPATDDLANMKVSSETFSKQSGLTNIYFQQMINGIQVFNAILNVHISRDNKLLTYGNRFVKVDNAARSAGANPLLNQEQALKSAMSALGISSTGSLLKKSSGNAPVYLTVFDKGKLALEDIKVQLVYQPIEVTTEKNAKEKTGEEKKPEQSQGLRLAWQVEIYPADAKNYWLARVDAATGILLDKNNYVVNCDFGKPGDASCSHAVNEPHQKNLTSSFSFLNFKATGNPVGSNDYRVYAAPNESPNHTIPLPPADGRTLLSNPANLTASPFGWHDTNGVPGAEFTITQGNNVHAYTDIDANNVPDAGSSPDGGANLVFDFPLDLTQAPSTYRPAAVTNLFYWNNYIHDIAYLYGFDELSGNFQVNNYGNGGLGNDHVRAEAQDGSGTNNANFATPPDGQLPRMQMYIGTNITPNVDGDLDNAVIAHEYAHGISNRLTGGPATASCLSNAEQMGEGWSDFFGYMLTMKPTDVGTAARGIGTYLFGQPANGPGIRPTPYSTNMAVNPSTYNTIKTVAIPHGVGYVWATMLWDLNWKFIDVYGFTDGFNKTMQLVMDGMKLQPCSPGFVDGRNAILAADQALYGGVNRCLIWEVFARRGLGFSATQGSSGSTLDGVEAFDLPVTCLLDVTPNLISICKPANAVFDITNSTNINYSMSAIGQPVGTTVSFSVNPVPGPGTATMTIGNTAAAAPGTYVITVTGTNGVNIISKNVTLTIHAAVPAAPVLVSPVNGATGVYNPNLTWNAVVAAETYDVQVATDAGFTNIIASANGLTNTNYQTPGLLNLTTYHWRVRGVNTCGNGNYSTAFSFTTANIICNTTASTNVPIVIPTTVATVTSTLTIPGCGGTIADINLKNLGITHTWIDDLVIDLTSPSGTTVRLMNRPCGSEDNILINFDDEAASPNFPCPPVDNLSYQPFAALSAFDGENFAGTWTLTVADVVSQDGGSINSWSLEICYVPAIPTVNAPTVTQPTCVTPTGTIVVNATGNSTLEYSVNNGSTWSASATFSGLAPDNYNIKVRLQSSPLCETAYANNPVVISEATGCCVPPTVNAPSVTQPTCETPTGTIVVNATGNSTLEYSVNNGSTWQLSATFSGLAPGNYNIKVRLQSNPSCETAYANNPVVISEATGCCVLPTVNAPAVTQPTCQLPTGTIVVNATGNSTLEYSVNNGSTWQLSATFSGLTPGNYNIKVRLQSVPSCETAYANNPVVLNAADIFTCPGNMVETITNPNVPCFKAVTTPNPVFCGTITKLTWKLTGATTLSSPTNGINYLGLRNMNVGTTTVTYTATFTGNIIRTCSFTVLVIETVPPNIYCPLDKDVNTDAGKCYKTGPVSLGTPTVSDNCGIVSITNNAPAVYQKGVNLVTWTVTDKSGNTATCVQRVTVYDAERPTISCPANVTVNADPGPGCAKAQLTLPLPVFNDNCEVVTLSWAMVGVTWGSSNTPGINYVPTMNYLVGISTITYTAIDAAGNSRTCTFRVTVNDVTAPVLGCPPAQTFCKVANNNYIVQPMVQSDNCTIVSTTYKITGATSRTGSGTNASGVFNQGVSTITWTVKDSHGNTSTCTTVVTVVATTNPVCTPPPFSLNGINPKITDAVVPGLSITAWPNPTVNYFNLKIISQAKETVQIRMFDMAGKLVQVKAGVAGDIYKLGEQVGPGMYIVEVSQGANKQMVKLVKVN